MYEFSLQPFGNSHLRYCLGPDVKLIRACYPRKDRINQFPNLDMVGNRVKSWPQKLGMI